jgi:hypothetical protein
MRSVLIELGRQLDDEQNAAHDLWTWLPSYAVARKHHGDRGMSYCPSVRDVMHEAAMYLACESRDDKIMTDEEKEWLTRCPCGEDHEGKER